MKNLACDPNDLTKRIKSDRKMKICNWTQHAILTFCLLTLLAAAAAVETDSDLVFDDGVGSNNELKSNTEHHKPSHHKHRNTTFVLIKRRAEHTATPAISPPSEEKLGLLDHLHDFGRRIKRGILDTWGLSGASTTESSHDENPRQKRQRQYNEEDNEVDYPRQRGDTDDEDDLDHMSSGSGSTEVIRGPRFYRVTMTIHEPYNPEFSNRNSASFKEMARNLSSSVELLYKDTPGRQAATLVSVQETSQPYYVKLTFDLGSQDYYDMNDLRTRMVRQVETYMKLGSLQVNTDNFSFRKFDARGSGPNKTRCDEEELECRSGECLPSENRCNGVEECSDGSDELGCSPIRLPSLTTEEPTVDRCRADDKVRCADGSIFICTVQLCDGVPDCPEGDDEHDCPNDCAEGEMMCDLTRCIPQSKQCNGEPDCTDGTDEQDCPAPVTTRPICKEDDFRCGNGMCIEYHRRCDNVFDCADKDDEIGCSANCRPDEFGCADGTCVDRRLVCDRRGDCDDLSDETSCPGSACHESEWQCDNGVCIDRALRCDGKGDCKDDDSDERQCRPGCAANEFMCHSDRNCIPLQLKCNRQQDCSDNSDEDAAICGNPPCRSDQFRCEDGLCLNINQRCNQITECYNGEDERGCATDPITPPSCEPNHVRCGDGQCVPSEKRCDGIFDCVDAADERDCGRCIQDQFRCEDGQCISTDQHCDGRRDCKDGSDELDCDNCLPGQFQCRDRTCVESRYRCNGSPECRDRSDEDNCPPVEPDCRRDEFRCGDGPCINQGFRCDGFKDCNDDSDERDCPNSTPEPVTCASWQHTCSDGTCVDGRLRCDGRPDCRDRSDEAECRCQDNEFTCSSGDCVPSSSRCNRRYDCRDGSDERDCPTTATSRPGCPFYEFSCRSGGQCVPESAVCNSRYECNDRSDEDNCPNRPPEPPTEPGRLNLKTYPADQIIKESREVVFQCRDEGPLRARVHWIRGNNLPLPPGSRDNNGRLEIPNIQMEHSGTYVCQAVGYPQSSPGSEVFVTLQVEAFEHPPTRPPTACGLTEATCANGECIRKQLVCDGRHDCSDGSDEMRCSPHGCEPNEFRCANKKCVLKTWRCDSENDCGDNSDEDSCATNPPGSPCKFHEFQCRSGNQCIPRSFHCDQEIDCQDGSDEIGCSPVYVQTPPPPMIMLNIGQVFTITCTAVGVPTPEISWRLNWGHIPEKCVTRSVNGVGTLTCDNIQEADQGAYSCEAINNRGSVIAVPDTILVIKQQESPCPRGYFNEEARNPRDCISCFCFGVSTDCKSADLFTYQLPPPFDEYKLLSVRVPGGSGPITIRPDFLFGSQPPTIRPGKQGFQVNARSNERLDNEVIPYFAIPQNYHGNQLKSYGGYLKYAVRYEGTGRPVQAPDVILSGNDYTLVHTSRTPSSAGRDTDMSVRFFYGEWYKRDGARSGGDIPSGSGETLATREEIMMALGDVDNILIKSQYITGPTLVTSITNINMDSAGLRNTGQGKASYVEECRCPVGYSGLSCENCVAGYERSRSGLWLGSCTREPAVCRPGTYGDPARGIPCEACPCPLTSPSNQFGRTCHLDTDNQVTCDCPPGYTGRRCETCAAGFQGNPFIAGNTCERETTSKCDASGSISSVSQPDSSGSCPCKVNVGGSHCNQCKPSTFNLDAVNQFGCISCFCMGITSQCSSSNWYRQQVSTAFVRNSQDFKIVTEDDITTPDEDGIQFNPNSREITYQNFPSSNSPVYYWYLPSQFLGDKVTSYGGVLTYTVRYEPLPGGHSRNNAADVILMSANDIKLLYFGRDQMEPNRPQTVVVSLLEQHWQADNGEAANREQMLMTLADLKGILIKATYTTNTRQAALSLVSLDIAEERNTGQSRAVAVEQCQCPAGYRGLSCEDCDVGYTRSEEGIYLGLCEPCNCNQHSSECDAETGICLNCKDNTRGDECDQCDEGFEGDATRGRPDDCRRSSGVYVPCDCDTRGSTSTDCRDGQCVCKTNVEGKDCDQCRQGCYGLSSAHSEGCLECFCSGVTDQCQSSNLYRTEIPMQIIDSNHGFTLTDTNGHEVIRNGFTLVESENEIGYSFSGGRSQRLFWSLPPAFTGNKVTSYGGNLTITQRYTSRYGPPTPDQDVILVGNGVTLYWTNVDSVIQPNRQVTYSVPLRESFWTRLEQSGPHPATRGDLITALANLEVILIRATHTNDMLSTHLSDVSLDTAVPQYTGQDVASDVETCRCPVQYRGTSCELCAPGYYRDVTDRSDSVFGSCKRCPCSSREESCSAEQEGRVVTCVCQQGYFGRYCNSTEPVTDRPSPAPRPPPPRPTISITISEPTIQIVEAGSTVRFRCLGQSLVQKRVSLHWSKEGGQLPPDRAIDDRQGLLVITDVRVSDSGSYICAANDGLSTVTERAVLTVGGSPPSPPRVIIEPRQLDIFVGQPIEFRCQATGNPAPTLRWIADNRPLSPDLTFDNGVFRISSARRSDEGTYECIASSSSGTDRISASVRIKESDPLIFDETRLTISPSNYNGRGGQTVQLSCVADEQGHQFTIQWSRPGSELPPSAVDRNGVLTIYNASPADSGVYVCTATSFTTSHREQQKATVTIRPIGDIPSVSIEPERQTVFQGTVAEVRCHASGEPTPSVRWIKAGEELPRNAQVIGSLLRIDNVVVRDRGVYVCEAHSEGGTAQGSAVIEVERREPPSIQVHPESPQRVTTGGSAQLQCRVMGGIPSPTLRWTRLDGRPIGNSVQELPGGVLRFTQVTTQDAGQYTCHAENIAGKVTAMVTLEILSMPRITLEPSTTARHTVGDYVRLECKATGDPQPTVQWSKYTPGTSGYETSRLSSSSPQLAILEITRVSKDDEGSYICTARNEAGDTEQRLQLVVNERRGDIPADTSDDLPTHSIPFPPATPSSGSTGVIEQDVFRVPIGGSAAMRCQVRGNRDRIFLDWVRKDNAEMPVGYLIRDGILHINHVQPSAAGEYSCLGISPSGQTVFTAKATLAVYDPLRIKLNPSRQVVRPGDNALITCSATGDQPMTIQWSARGRSFSPRVRVDQGRLYFTGIEVSDAGTYVCTASNSGGREEAAAEVVVSEHQTRPTVQAEHRDQSTTIGSSIKLRCTIPADSQAHNAQITWTRIGAALPRNSRVRGEELELVNVQTADQGRYVCEVRNIDGAASDYVDLRVEPAAAAPSVVVRIEPSQSLARDGDTVDLRCIITGSTTSNAQVSWTKKWDSLESNAQAYGNLLRISGVRQNNAGTYTCSVRTPTGRVEEDYELVLHDNDGMTGDATAVTETRTAPHGSTVMMDCRTDLEQPVTYTWSKQGGPLPDGSNTQEQTLTLRDIGAADAGTYVCTASNSIIKVDIPTVLVVTGVVPFFPQAPSSYMALPTLPDAYITFSIEVSFKPESGDGLILYNGQERGGGGDFISLGLNGSYIEFRFNVGSGPALIRSPYPINLGEWHTVKLHRTRKEGSMYVDGVGPVKGVALGRFQGLDLVEPLYVGGVPDFTDIHRLNGFTRGFVGCISRLVIGSVEHELVRDATLSRGVTTCETCAINPCQNQGVCQEAATAKGYTCICPASFSGQNCDRVGQACMPGVCGTGRCVNREVDGFDCLCPFGRGGAKCEQEIDINEPAFADDAYIAYPTPKAVRRLNMALSINPRTLDDGVLLYCAQSDHGLGDFASLAIRDKRLEFRFDTGSGPAILRSDRELVAGEWVTVTANRDSKEGHLSVDNETPIHGRSPGDKRGLNLRTPLYIGGFDKHRVRVAQGVGVARGFHGCISNIQVSGLDMNSFKSLVDSANVEDCSSFHESSKSCDHNPCLNGGQCSTSAGGGYTCSCPKDFSGHNCETTSDICEKQQLCQNGGRCIPVDDHFNCRCPLGFAGEHCQNMADLNRDVSFNSDGYIELRNSLLPHKDSEENEIITIEFTTTERNGLMLWHGQEAEAEGRGQDYLSLALVDGYLEFSYELGSGPALIRSSDTVNDGRRHKVVLRRQGSDGSIEIDQAASTMFGESGGLLTSLNTRGNIYIGGVEDFALMTGGRHRRGFTGCIHKIMFQDVDINIGTNAVNGVNAQPCSNSVSSYEDDDNDNDILDNMDRFVH